MEQVIKIQTNKRTNQSIVSRLATILGVLILLFSFQKSIAQDPEKFIRAGNKLYKDSLYEAAAEKFEQALEVDPNYDKGIFNQGNAYYQQKNYEEALKNFELSAGLMEDPAQKAAAYHNLGNTLFDSQQYDKSIEAYKNALRNNPNDADTKYNLMVAKKMLQDQQNQNQDQNQDQENQDQQNQDQENKENQDQENQDQQNQENQDQNDQQNQDQEQKESDQKDGNKGEEGKEDGEKKEQPAMTPSKLTPEEVQRILESLSNDEKNTVKELMKKEHKAKPNKSDKDW